MKLDFGPRIVAFAGRKESFITYGRQERIDFGDPGTVGLLDLELLYADLLEHKTLRGHGNVFVPRPEIAPILANCTVTVNEVDLRDSRTLQVVAHPRADHIP